MRYTPFLDHCGIKIADSVSDGAANIIDAALAAVSSMVDWGSHNGRKRKPCKGQPLLLAGKPIGQYHCESCGEMQLAGMAHMPPDEDYEAAYGCEWPEGYAEEVKVDEDHRLDPATQDSQVEQIRVWQIVGYLDDPMHGEGPTAREAVLWALHDYRIEEEVMGEAVFSPVCFEARPWLDDETLGEAEQVELKAQVWEHETFVWKP